MWQRTETQTTFNHAVASAEGLDVHCTLHDVLIIDHQHCSAHT